MKKILFVIGSLRAKSFNRQMANVAKEIIGNSANVQELDYSDLPLLNQDIEQPEPAAVARIRKAITEADGLWIFTPEYNMSYPGHLKNLLDWMSRPVKFMDYGTPTCINGKRVAISGAGGKAATGDIAVYDLRGKDGVLTGISTNKDDAFYSLKVDAYIGEEE